MLLCFQDLGASCNWLFHLCPCYLLNRVCGRALDVNGDTCCHTYLHVVISEGGTSTTEQLHHTHTVSALSPPSVLSFVCVF